MIIFTQHAILKLEQRRIKKSFVIQTLGRSDHAVSIGNNNFHIFKKFRTLYLKVVCKKDGKNTIVITQYWTDKLK